MKNILIVDDHPVVVAGLTGALCGLGRIYRAATAADAIRLARTTTMHLALVDVNLSGPDGLALTRRLQREPGPPRVIVISGSGASIYSARARRAGAWAFLCKTAEQEAITKCARQVLAGFRLFPFDDRCLARHDEDAQGLDVLTDRELVMLKLLVGCPPQRVIARQMSLSIKTVSAYKMRIMRKLGAESIVDLVTLAHMYGID